jgi:hypothetical protein
LESAPRGTGGDLRAFEDGVEIEAQRFDTRVPRADA